MRKVLFSFLSVQLYTGAQINFGDLTPYLTHDIIKCVNIVEKKKVYVYTLTDVFSVNGRTKKVIQSTLSSKTVRYFIRPGLG